MTLHHPSIQEVLSDRVRGWRGVPGMHPAAVRPVVAISRQSGARGREVALALGERLGVDVHDRDIIHRIAERTHLREDAVLSFEQEDRPLLSDWLSSFASEPYLSPYGYAHHLAQVVLAISRSGGAVILGRGAHLILRPGQALRVFVVAPLQQRVETIMARFGVDAREAEHRIGAKEAERRLFLRKYFHAEYGDPATFDLVVNTGVLGVPGAVDAVHAALQRMIVAAQP